MIPVQCGQTANPAFVLGDYFLFAVTRSGPPQLAAAGTLRFRVANLRLVNLQIVVGGAGYMPPPKQ